MPTQLTIKESLARPTSARKQKKRVKKRAAGLNKTERKQVRDIVKSKKEQLYCSRWYKYDDALNYGDFLQKPIVGQATLPNVYNGAFQACTGVVLQMGNYLNVPSVTANGAIPNLVYPMGGLGMIRGVDNDDITGNFAYMNSRQLHLQINALPFVTNGNQTDIYFRPLELRVLHVTMKSNADEKPNLLDELFLDQQGTREGIQSICSCKDMMSDWKVNTDQYKVHRDFKIKLQQRPADPTAAINNATLTAPAKGQIWNQGPTYSAQYNCSFWLDRPKKKLRFNPIDNLIDNDHEPLNANLQDYVIILATRFETAGNPGTLNAGPQTSGQWQVRASGVTKYREA